MKNKIKIDFNGKELEFFYGLSFLGYFLKIKDTDIKGVFDSINSEPYSYIPELMYQSYLHNCERREEKPTIKKFELSDLIEETGHFKDGSKSSVFVEAFLQSIIDSLPKDESEDAGDSKKK